MFWGLKLFGSKKHNEILDKPLHISHGVLDPKQKCSEAVELHIVIDKIDYILCVLDQSKGIIQQSLNLEMSEGEEMTVYLTGPADACVHLSGYYKEETINQSWEDIDGLWERSFSVSDDEEEFTSSNDLSVEKEDENNTVPGMLSHCIDSEDEEMRKSKKRKRVSFDLQNNDTKPEKPREKKGNSSLGENQAIFEGQTIEDLKYGHGKIAKSGRKVYIRYKAYELGGVGKKVIDSIGRKQKPLCFKLGKAEVMRGLDKGINGMRVGGKRRIVVPPSERKEGEVPLEIPKDMTLVFDVDLVNVD